MSRLQIGYVMCLLVLASWFKAFALGPEWIGRIPPDFMLKTIDDRTAFSLNDLRGQVVVIDFWATWCPPCRRSLTQLAALDAKHGKLTVLAVNVDNERRNAAEFMKRNRIQIKALFDEKKEVVEEYGVSAMPSAFVIDKHGVLRFIHSGYTDSEVEQIKNEIKDLL